MFKVNDLVCERNGRVLFRDLAFSLNSGDILHVQGSNGVGKSSLLRILCGLLEPAAGSVLWNNQDIYQDSSTFTANVGYLGHKLGLKSQLTVLENLRLFAQAPSEHEERTWLSQFDVLDVKHQRVETLSAGQQQRVALARLLARKARLWLLDEPFTAIDQQGSRALEQVMLRHQQSGGMIIFTSHQDVQLPGASVRLIGLHA